MSFIDELWEDRESWQSWIYTKLMNIIARKKASLAVAAGILVFIYSVCIKDVQGIQKA